MQLPLYLIYNPPTFMSLSKDMVKVAASFSYWHLTMHTAYSTPSDLEEDNDTDLNLTNPPRPSKMVASLHADGVDVFAHGFLHHVTKLVVTERIILSI